jgi:hypothetical protein
MVSLNTDRSFDSLHEDAPLLVVSQPRVVLYNHESHHRKLHTSWSTAVGIALLTFLEVAACVPTLQFEKGRYEMHNVVPFVTRSILHVMVWFLLLLITYYGERQHRRSRLQGFLKFNRETLWLRRMPLLMSSYANAGLLLFGSVVPVNEHITISRQSVFEIIVSIEVVMALPCYIYYFAKVFQFNRKSQRPDSMSGLNGSRSNGRAENAEQAAIEHQADMLKFMQQYTKNLQEEIRRLRSLLEQRAAA